MANDPDVFVPPPGGAVPAPPSADSSLTEVVIRTMRSDLAKLGQTGGSTPQGDVVSIRFTRSDKGTLSASVLEGPASAAAARAQTPASRTKLAMFVGVGGAGLVFLFLIGYFVLPAIFGGSGNKDDTDLAPRGGELPQDGTRDVFLGHQSYFRVAADETTQGDIERLSPSVDASFYELVTQATAFVAPETEFVEIEAVGAGGNAMPWVEFLRRRGANILSADFFNQRFEQDFTLFLYRGTAGWRPGYILKLRKGEQAVTLRNAVRALENDPSALGRLFAEPPGRIMGAFADEQVAGQPVRVLTFSAPDAAFVYGWFFNDHLIMSTSLDGLKKAISRL
jgi:hypothetical protein